MPHVRKDRLVREWVDFHWEVDGKMYEFSLPGGGFVSFTDLVEVLGIAISDNDGEEDPAKAAEKFVADVEKVEFSDPSLVNVSKVEEDTIVGAIKDALGLVCEYSAELTEAEIAEINATRVQAGDWALIGLKAFDTEENLTVTMKTGEMFTIRVTDAQANPFGLDGNQYSLFGINKDNHNSYGLLNQANNDGSLRATTNASSAASWIFEYTGEDKLYLIHDGNNNYIIVDDNGVRLTTNKTEAEANPILVHSKDGKYAFTDATGTNGINIYSSGRFGRWNFGDGSDANFWLTLQSTSDKSKPGTITTADTSGLLTINLFNYGSEDDLDDVKNHIGGTVYSKGLNSHQLQFYSYGTEGTGINYFTGGAAVRSGIVADQLVDNYPVLNTENDDVTWAESLKYLFKDGDSNVTPYTGVNHLFTLDENGYYHYDSNDNYAYYNPANGNKDFTVYSKTFPEEGADNQYFGVGFFPFNDYDEYYNCIHGKNFNGWHGDDANKEGHYDHHFGMSLTGNFIMPPDGQYNGRDVTYEFSGDDDMWVFIDGVLILDIGGIHNPATGSINFTDGTVMVNGVEQTNLKDKYKEVTGRDWDDSVFSNHDFRVFYMERGGMYSNLEVTFNLPLTPITETGEFTFNKVSSENESLKLANAKFALFEDEQCNTPFSLATVPVTAVSDKNGQVSFKNIPYGTYYMKETEFPTGYQGKNPEEIFKVVINANGATVTNASGTGVTKVTNEPKKIDIEVEKIWHDSEGNTANAPAGANVEIVLGRYKLVEDPNAQGEGSLVIKDSYTGLPDGSSYRVTYTITGPDGYSKTISKTYTGSEKSIEETVSGLPAGVQYTVSKQVQGISYYNTNNGTETATVTVPKKGSVDANFSQTTFNRNAYRVRVYAVNGQNMDNLGLYSEAWYSPGSQLSIKIEEASNAQGWGLNSNYGDNFIVSSSAGGSKTFTQAGTWKFTNSLQQDIDLYVKAKNKSSWQKGWGWIKEPPTITGGTLAQASSSSKMMMSVRRTAVNQTAVTPTLPTPPKDMIYELDTGYASDPDKITLSGGTWTGKAEGLNAYNEYGPYVYYIAAVNETGVADGTTLTISDNVSLDGSLQRLIATNTLPPVGSLKITKIVTIDGARTSSLDESLRGYADGSYTFVIKKDGQPITNGKVNGTAITDGKVTITITNGVAGTVEVTDLEAGEYTIEEETPSNGTTLTKVGNTEITSQSAAAQKVATVTVVAGKSGDDVETASVASFTNNAETTSLNVKKEWDDTTPANKKQDVTFEVWQRVFVENNEEQVEVADRAYKTGIALPADGTWVAVSGLPTHGVETYNGNSVAAVYEYHIEENVPAGFFEDYKNGEKPGEVVIHNTPYGEIQETTDVSIEKKWVDLDNNDASGDHADDQISFTLTKTKVRTDCVQVNVSYRNGNGSRYGNAQSFFVTKGTELDFTISKPSTLTGRPYATVQVDGNEKGRFSGNDAGTMVISTGPITTNADVVVSLGYNGLIGSALNEWGEEAKLETIGLVPHATWASQMTVNSGTGTKYDTAVSMLADMDKITSPDERVSVESSTYTMKVESGNDGKQQTVISGPDNIFKTVDNQTWSGVAEKLPRLERAQDGSYYAYRYSISELNIIHAGSTEPVTYDKNDPSKGESKSFEVSIGKDGVITNKEKEKKVNLEILKVDNTAQTVKLENAEFSLKKIEPDANLMDLDSKATAVGTGKTDEAGKLSFNFLGYGYYELSETKAPSGYVFAEDTNIYIKVDKTGVKMLQMPKDKTAAIKDWATSDNAENVLSFSLNSEKTVANVTVGNTPGKELPHTGGPGTGFIRLAGILLLIAGAALVGARRIRSRA